MMKAVVTFLLFGWAACGLVFAQQDPDDWGIQDSVIVGNVAVDSGATEVWVPLDIFADDSVGFINIPLTWNSSAPGITPDSVVFDSLFLCWEPFSMIFPSERYIRILAWRQLWCPLVFPESLRVRLLSIRFSIAPDAPPQALRIDTTWDDRNGSLLLGLVDGMTEVTPAFRKGRIFYANPSGLENAEGQLALDFELHGNYPNPFNASTKIDFSLSSSQQVSLAIYNLLGQRVRTLVNEDLEAGPHSIVWDGTDEAGLAAPSGVYFCRLAVSGRSETRKMLMLR